MEKLLLQRSPEGMPRGLYPMSLEIGKILFHSKPVTLVAGVSKENKFHPPPPGLFSATTRIDLAKSMPR
jgi:hypothetical protein